MADDKPISDSQAGDRLHAALGALGSAPGATISADTALTAARKALALLTLGLIASGEKQAQMSDPRKPD